MSGYWFPVTCIAYTASIDWCESNYAVSFYIAEFWNCVSSLCISAAGVYGIAVVRRCRGTALEYLMSVLFIVVGLGSAAFHCTLQYAYQLWDEIPMLWVGSTYSLLSALFTYSQLHPRGKAHTRSLFVALIGYNIVWYYVHSSNALVVAFQTNFVCLLLAIFACMVDASQVYSQWKLGDGVSLRFLRLYVSTTVIAFVAWLLDSHLCPYLSALPVNPQLHSWWHFFCSLSSYNSLLFEILLQLRNCKALPVVSGRFFPTLHRPAEP